jgi:uncharacterized membrane protein YbhN (UPF0104 family)
MFHEPLHFSDVFWTQAIGYLANNLLPLRLGDVGRILLLRALVSISSFRIGFTLVIERFLDIVSTLLLFLFAASYLHVSGDIVKAFYFFSAAAFFVLIVAAIFYFYVKNAARASGPNLFEKIATEYGQAIDAIVNKKLATFVFLSLASITLSVCTVWSALRGFNPDATFQAAAAVTTTITFAMAIPSAPANLGVFQFAGQLALLSIPGNIYSASSAFAIISVIHAIHIVGTTVIGIIAIWCLSKYGGHNHEARKVLRDIFRMKN